MRAKGALVALAAAVAGVAAAAVTAVPFGGDPSHLVPPITHAPLTTGPTPASSPGAPASKPPLPTTLEDLLPVARNALVAAAGKAGLPCTTATSTYLLTPLHEGRDLRFSAMRRVVLAYGGAVAKLSAHYTCARQVVGAAVACEAAGAVMVPGTAAVPYTPDLLAAATRHRYCDFYHDDPRCNVWGPYEGNSATVTAALPPVPDKC